MPFALDSDMRRIDDTPAHKALREAIANCLTNANYYERRGIVCVWGDDAITIENPGDFRLPIEEARKPGASDPRNETMLKIFSFVNVGERAGSGMGTIENGWTAGGYPAPTYEVVYGPDRTKLTLPLVTIGESTANRTEKPIDSSGRFRTERTETARHAILALFADGVGPLKSADIARRIGLGKTRTNELLRDLVIEGALVAEGSARSRVYKRADN